MLNDFRGLSLTYEILLKSNSISSLSEKLPKRLQPPRQIENPKQPLKEALMTTNTTTPAPAATLTEKELWALFVRNVMHTSLGAGTVIERYRPDDHLRDTGAWGMIADFSNALSDGVEEAGDPEGELSMRIEEIENYLVLLKIVQEDFRKVKSALEIDDGDDDAEPRFRMPVIAVAPEAA